MSISLARARHYRQRPRRRERRELESDVFAALGDSRLDAAEATALRGRAIEMTASAPDLARARFVTRQHIQALVNALLADELVTLEDNPQHKRSSLIGLTAAGGRVIARMRHRETQLFETIDWGVEPRTITLATETLKHIRKALPVGVKQR